jgi:integrase
MGKVTIKIPLVTWRDGRPRYWPSAAQRTLGYKGEDLRHPPFDKTGLPIGVWFTLDEAIAWSKNREQDIADRRQQLADGTSARKIRKQVGKNRLDGLTAVSQLFDFWFADPRMNGEWKNDGKKRRRPLADNTVRYYKGAARIVEAFDEGGIWNEPAAALRPKAIMGILDRIEVLHGLAQARAVRATLSSAFSFGCKQNPPLVPANPMTGLAETLPVLDPRVRYGSMEEMRTLIKGMDALGYPEMGDSIMLGLFTATRQTDRIALIGGQVTDAGILFTQNKKNKQPLLIPIAPEVLTRLANMRARRKEWKVKYPHVLLCEKLKSPWNSDWYRKVFRVLRIAIATGDVERNNAGEPSKDAKAIIGELNIQEALKAAGIEPMASLIDFRDQDLRDTSVTWLALAGCNKFEIASITGHSLKTIDEILKHYLGLHPELARTAIAKLVTYYDEANAR